MGPGSEIIATNNPTKILYQGGDLTAHGVFGPNNNYVYFPGGSIYRLNIVTGNVKKFEIPLLNDVRQISIYNY